MTVPRHGKEGQRPARMIETWNHITHEQAKLLTTQAKSVYPIEPTPFLDDGSIDHASIDRLTDFYLGCGATGITVLGQLGEAPKPEHAKSVAIASQMIRHASNLPVIVGAPAPGFAAKRAMTREVMDAGAAGVLIAPPNTLRGFERDARMRHIPILCGNGGLFLDYEMSRGADGANTATVFPTCCAMWCGFAQRAKPKKPTTCSTPTCR